MELVKEQKEAIKTLEDDKERLAGKQNKLEKEFISLRKKKNPDETPEESVTPEVIKSEIDLRVYKAAIIELLHNNGLLNYSADAQSEFLTFFIDHKEFDEDTFTDFKNSLIKKYKDVEKAKKDKMIEEEQEKSKRVEEEKKNNPETLDPPNRPSPTGGIAPDKEARLKELKKMLKDPSINVLQHQKTMDEIYELEVRPLLGI